MGTTIRPFDAAHLMQFACGFDSLSGDVRGIAVIGTPGAPQGGQETSFSLYKVESIEDFMRSLEMSASLNIQSEYGKGSAKADFVRKLKTHNYSVYVAVTVTINSGTRILNSPKLDDTAAELLKTSVGQEKFRKMYGDEFLAGITSGGEFIAFLEIETSNSSDFQEASLVISGSDTTGTVSGSASVHSSLQQIKSKYQLKVHTFQQGGSNPDAVITPETLIDKAMNFPSTLTSSNTFDYSATFQSYDVLPRPDGANPIDVQNQRDILEKLGLYRIRYQSVLDSIEYVLNNPEQFVPFDSNELTQAAGKISAQINDLMTRASMCFSSYESCALPTNLIDPVMNLPERLTKDESDATQAAKKAALAAQAFAVAAQGHAARVLEISQAIKTGPGGKALADEAKIRAKDAATAADSSQQQANVAVVSGGGLAAADQWIAQAKSAAKQAEDANGLAGALQEKVYKIGYAPYWKATSLALDDLSLPAGLGNHWGTTDLTDVAPTPVEYTNVSQVGVDPGGGAVLLVSIGTNVLHHPQGNIWVIDGLNNHFNTERSGLHILDGRYAVALRAAKVPGSTDKFYDLTGVSWPVPLALKSSATGLLSVVNVTAHCAKVPSTLGMRISDTWELVE